MEFRKIQMFVEVVRQQGFSRAAEVLFTTQSTVSKAVRQLENELDSCLLDRGVRGVVMTDAGEVVFRRGERLLAERGDMLREMDELRGLARGTLVLGLPQIGAGALFAPVFTEYRKRFPGVEIRLVEHGSDQLEEVLRAGGVELAASLLPVPGDFEWLPVRREPLVALLSPDHPQADLESMPLDRVRDVPFILFEDGFALNRIILGACRRRGFEPSVITKSSQIGFICSLAEAGLGVAFLPRLIAEERRGDAVRLVRLEEPDTDWDMAVIWRRGGYLSSAARAWLDVVRDLYGGSGRSV
ncbi:LysR family transcriptional regulator [Pseudodesulfovibrio thermohalotolerans]|uniref:LysR family transcriptional regulator n=1 Tax=Pseudodesulfovibrio thermohalotolerans TaxID=2880651 RepID=UPI002442D52E|nr:LysR family transcriptional regulator [Pseudodesulfovibrio thermohalotolerans]WFS62331.1 LysR family transcriptional regulator [Pseudodesulfovibrio thermohalotolerans]